MSNAMDNQSALHMHDAILNKELVISWKKTDSAKSSGKGGGVKPTAKSRKAKYRVALSKYSFKPKA